MSDWTAIEAGIRRHLDRVGAAYGGTLEERAEICAQVEEHIRAALSARGDAVTVEDLQAVLAEMDPPASYGDGGVRVAAAGPSGRSWVPGCLVAVAAVFLLLVLSNCVYLWLGYDADGGAEEGATADSADPAEVVSTMPQHDSFRDTHHRPAVPYRLEFATAGGEAGGS